MNDVMPESREDAMSPTSVPEDVRGLASCHDLISMLEHQVRTARALLHELTESRFAGTPAATSVVVGHCAELGAEAVEVVKATEMLDAEVCDPAAFTKCVSGVSEQP